ncbi:predicted protein [Sclerotinia sclerotiorum 1980 UF-70]|uniref:Uncharacterized protein n=1 Tax=Sclerotinia sclerotiorum (strain ATCC 18683 / 1980 / Ss-1) TaxID=665079 RepID=A7E9Z9_SCLS1|nr:predicted protein [Sclerotinia sclerotiorum 1980 UF-70]EDN99277.1 predicted protein [Sclerotinia sclerotiorum 1980 UF-70]
MLGQPLQEENKRKLFQYQKRICSQVYQIFKQTASTKLILGNRELETLADFDGFEAFIGVDDLKQPSGMWNSKAPSRARELKSSFHNSITCPPRYTANSARN